MDKTERYFINLKEDVYQCLTSADLEGCFRRLKEYIYKNCTEPEAGRKNTEIIHYQATFSRISQSKRLGEIDYTTYNHELNKITNNILSFLEILRPKDFEINNNDLFENFEVNRDNYWSYDDNLVTILKFGNDFGLLNDIFERFIKSQKEVNSIRQNIYFFDGIRKILIDESKMDTLDEKEKESIIIEPMDWRDAVIVQKKYEPYQVAEALVINAKDKSEIIIRTNSSTLSLRVNIMVDVITWFQLYPGYPNQMKEPFNVFVPYSSIILFSKGELEDALPTELN